MSTQIAVWDELWVTVPRAIGWQSAVPALLAGLRVCMGVGLGGLIGLASGNMGFWVLTGCGVGSVFSFLMGRGRVG